ncbi:hypothetical protein GOP47_0022924 [Adiantum capillus-veneris]|uniref:Pectinesterase n=1 Tax=Adiantum capillus-veneris TaxID=13818 RepID=A0A9D4U768_ADICA|nr:hypothetical protein GOP47_0022924 [Adiantum capillus-veneris]
MVMQHVSKRKVSQEPPTQQVKSQCATVATAAASTTVRYDSMLHQHQHLQVQAMRSFGERAKWRTGTQDDLYDDDESGNATSAPEGVRYVSVAMVGGGPADFTSIQAAIDSVPDNNIVSTLIRILPGIYEERVVVPPTKPFITLEGSGINETYVQWHLKASDTDERGIELTAYNTASVTVYASNFVAKDITFKNTLPPPPPGIEGRQAAAFRMSGDMATFYRCGFVGGQDTLCDDQGRHYFEDCFIQGSIDFVFGNARSLYNRCELNSIAQSYGSVAAQDRQSLDDNTGFAFVNCKITGNGPIYLGRAMGPFSRIIFAYSQFDDIIDPRGWDDWDHDTSKDGTVYYGQYKCDGPGANESQRVMWSHELTDEQALPFLTTSFIDGDTWLPHA